MYYTDMIKYEKNQSDKKVVFLKILKFRLQNSIFFNNFIIFTIRI